MSVLLAVMRRAPARDIPHCRLFNDRVACLRKSRMQAVRLTDNAVSHYMLACKQWDIDVHQQSDNCRVTE